MKFDLYQGCIVDFLKLVFCSIGCRLLHFVFSMSQYDYEYGVDFCLGGEGCGGGHFEADGSVKNISIVFHQKSNRLQHRNITNGLFQDNFANLNNISVTCSLKENVIIK